MESDIQGHRVERRVRGWRDWLTRVQITDTRISIWTIEFLGESSVSSYLHARSLEKIAYSCPLTDSRIPVAFFTGWIVRIEQPPIKYRHNVRSVTAGYALFVGDIDHSAASSYIVASIADRDDINWISTLFSVTVMIYCLSERIIRG